jgi:hypothetical protein
MRTVKIALVLMILFALFGCGQGHKFVQHTVDVDTAFGNYEWFYDTYNDIQATVQKAKVAHEMISQATSEDAKLNYQTDYTGAIGYLNSKIADYNSNSSKWNRTLFKDKKLPYKIRISVSGGDVTLSEE